MRHALLGAGLILYAAFFTPAYFEPMDAIISSGYLALLVQNYGDMGLVLGVLWAASGYCALIIGLSLIGHSLTKNIPFLRRFHGATRFIVHHPFKTSAIIFGISLVLAYILMLNFGMI